jgi:hypothetical protein
MRARSDSPPQPNPLVYFLKALASAIGLKVILCIFSTSCISKASFSDSSLILAGIYFQHKSLLASNLLLPATISKPSSIGLTIIVATSHVDASYGGLLGL